MKGDDNSNPISDTYSKEDANMISFGGFHDARDIIPVGRPISSYDQSYNQPSVQTPEAVREKELDTSNANAAASNTRVAKSKPESVSKNKQEVKTARKEAPNSFPSNVRSLISTGMLDGVPVKYVSLAREVCSLESFCSFCHLFVYQVCDLLILCAECQKELRGIIKGSGYLCSCQSCNYSKVIIFLACSFALDKLSGPN